MMVEKLKNTLVDYSDLNFEKKPWMKETIRLLN